MILADYHIHTSYSTDAKAWADPESCANRAVAMGLEEIVFTDHLDFKYRTLEPYPFIDMDAYVNHILRLKSDFAGRLQIRLGLELGLTPEIAHLARNVTDKYPFDFIICSTHDIKGVGIYGGCDYFGDRPKKAAYDEYFNEALAVIKADPDFCVYGHLDFLERYAPYDDVTAHLNDFADVTDTIFKLLIESGRGLEVNTSGYRYGLGRTNPKPEYLRRFKELGGEILTLGSDAHSPDHIASNFPKAQDMLLSLGFKYLARYEGMKPRMVRI